MASWVLNVFNCKPVKNWRIDPEEEDSMATTPWQPTQPVHRHRNKIHSTINLKIPCTFFFFHHGKIISTFFVCLFVCLFFCFSDTLYMQCINIWSPLSLQYNYVLTNRGSQAKLPTLGTKPHKSSNKKQRTNLALHVSP